VAVKEDSENEFGRFLSFETLTLFPFDSKSIDKSLLTSEEKAWINGYHKNVFEKLTPNLNAEEIEWLRSKTATI
jgi:Xaa-Pro aminopeptidase